jgi:hypothetical protein
MPATDDVRPAQTELQEAGYRALVFGSARNPCDDDNPRHPRRTRGLVSAHGRSDLGARPWLWVEYPDTEADHARICEIARRHHVRLTTFAAPLAEWEIRRWPDRVLTA